MGANRCNNCYQVSCQIINRNVDTYTGLSNLPIKTLKQYILEVVQMTKVDMNRTLREKTDFVDKIIQFKGIDPEKTQYYENTHHQMTNSHIQDVMNTAWELDDDEELLETNLPDNNENMTTDNENENIISSNPILHSTPQNSDLNN